MCLIFKGDVVDFVVFAKRFAYSLDVVDFVVFAKRFAYSLDYGKKLTMTDILQKLADSQ